MRLVLPDVMHHSLGDEVNPYENRSDLNVRPLIGYLLGAIFKHR